jgi:hypothetical protein
MTPIIWKKERCLEEARRFTCTRDWKAGSPISYQASLDHGYFQDCTRHFKPLRRKPWTLPELKKLAKQYSSRNEFKRRHRGAYEAALVQGVMNVIFKHVPRLENGRKVETRYSVIDMKDLAQVSKSRSKFRKRHHAMYQWASKRNLLKEIFEGIPKMKRRRKKR